MSRIDSLTDDDPLFTLVSVVDDVFTSYPAFGRNQHRSLGRIYEAWLDWREVVDPDFRRGQFPKLGAPK